MGLFDFGNRKKISISSQTVRLSMSDIDKYRWVMGDYLYQKYCTANLVYNQQYFNVGIELFNKWKEKYKKEEDQKAIDSQMSEKSQLAIQHEKSGNIEEAIRLYQELVDTKYDWLFVYTRLIILYRKQKMYDKEIATIKSTISHFGRKKGYEKEKEKLQKRMIKAKELQIKHNLKTNL